MSTPARDLLEKVGISILKTRLALKMTQEELAKILGISRAALSKVESGKAELRLSHYLRLRAHVLTLPASPAVLNAFRHLDGMLSIDLETRMNEILAAAAKRKGD